MGWWECYDGTVIGDELADLVGDWLDKLVDKMVLKYPLITRDQVLHTLSFCSGYLKHFDKNRQLSDLDKTLVAMTVKQMRGWKDRHPISPDLSKRVAPGTELTNVYNPFTSDVV